MDSYCRCEHLAEKHQPDCFCGCIAFVGVSSPAYKNGMVSNNPSDPANVLLDMDSPTEPEVFDEYCYICTDPEFAAMGLPLCRPCRCGPSGHVPADDVYCTSCGEAYEYEEAMGDLHK